jgi:hypothetical protein
MSESQQRQPNEPPFKYIVQLRGEARTIHVKTVFGGASHYGEGARSLIGQNFSRDPCNPDDTLKTWMCFAYSIEFNAQPVDNGRV